MKNKTVKVLLILLIIVMAVASFAACKKTPPPADPGGDGNTSQKEVADGAYIPGGINKISLNGEWDFYKDTRARAVTVAQDSGTLSKVALAAGETAVMKLFVDESAEIEYAKISAVLDFGYDIAAADGGPAYVYAKLNDGAWFKTAIDNFKENRKSTKHTIDIGLNSGAVQQGENTVYLKTNIAEGDFGIYASDASAGNASIIGADEQETSLNKNFAIRIKYYPVLMFDEDITTISVPAVWELQLDDENEYTAYNGVGWYMTEFELPVSGAGKQFTLTFDAVDYYAEIWINNRFICSHENGYSKIEIDLAECAEFLNDGSNNLTVRVTDQDTSATTDFKIKETLAGFFHDSVGINYGGIWNDVYLTERGELKVTDITVNTDISKNTASVSAIIKNVSEIAKNGDAKITVYNCKGEEVGSADITGISLMNGETKKISAEITIENATLWELDNPYLYTAKVQILRNDTEIDMTYTTFGMTKLEANGTKILFNNKAVKFNGILSWLGNWEQISPRYDEETFTTQIRELKKYGFNTIKFCLVVPPDYLLDICDKEGIYVYIEYPIWNPVQTDAFFERAYSQMAELINMAKNHPCVVMSDFNCEMPSFSDEMKDLMTWCVATGMNIDSNRLFAANSSTGAQNIDGEIDFWTYHPYMNLLGFKDSARSIAESRNSGGDKPVVFGEYADYPAFADFDKVIAANGGEIPWNWTVVDDPFRADIYLKKLGYSDGQIKDIIEKSQQNSVEAKMWYVQETKKADDVAAYFITIIQDIGHSVAGFFDETGDVKFDSSQTTFLKETALLMEDTVLNYSGGVKTEVTPAVSHYSGVDLKNASLSYSVTDSEGVKVAGGVLQSGVNINNGQYFTFDVAELEMPQVSAAEQHKLTFELTADGDYSTYSSWDIVVYPTAYLSASELAGKTVMVSKDSSLYNFKERYPFATDWVDGSNPDLLVAFGSLNSSQLEYLNNGGKVFYVGTGSEVAKVQTGVYYSQYVFINFPQAEHPVVKALGSKGYGGLQFLNMHTTSVITEAADNPLSHSLIGKIVIRDNVPESAGQSGSFMSEFTKGRGTVIQSTLNFAFGDPVLGPHIIDVTMRYMLGTEGTASLNNLSAKSSAGISQIAGSASAYCALGI